MRKYTGFFSIIILLLGVSSLFLANYSTLIANNLLSIVLISYIVSLSLGLISKRGIWKKTALTLIVLFSIFVVILYTAMPLIWNRP